MYETRLWARTAEEKPADGTHVEVITEGGMQTELIYSSNLWWLTDRSMYVYYTPVFWREID